MVYPVAVQHRAAQLLDHRQGTALSRAGAAGEAQHDLLAVRLHHMKARRLFQPVAHGHSQALPVRALGIDLGDGAAVKGAQGLKHPLGLGQLILHRADGADHLAREKAGVFIKADHA